MTTLSFQVTKRDIEQYANASGDMNPIHLDEGFAQQHGFTTTIAHGMLTMAKIWAVLSQNLFPYSIPMQYDLAFLLPVHAGDAVTLHVTQYEQTVTLEGVCKNRTVVRGTIDLSPIRRK